MFLAEKERFDNSLSELPATEALAVAAQVESEKAGEETADVSTTEET